MNEDSMASVELKRCNTVYEYRKENDAQNMEPLKPRLKHTFTVPYRNHDTNFCTKDEKVNVTPTGLV